MRDRWEVCDVYTGVNMGYAKTEAGAKKIRAKYNGSMILGPNAPRPSWPCLRIGQMQETIDELGSVLKDVELLARSNSPIYDGSKMYKTIAKVMQKHGIKCYGDES